MMRRLRRGERPLINNANPLYQVVGRAQKGVLFSSTEKKLWQEFRLRISDFAISNWFKFITFRTIKQEKPYTKGFHKFFDIMNKIIFNGSRRIHGIT